MKADRASGEVVVPVARPPNCSCGNAVADSKGRILRVRSCPICMGLLLDSWRGVEYAIATERDGDGTKRVLLKQKEFFST